MSFLEGQLDHVVICHGTIIDKDIYNATIPHFDETMLVNVRSVMHLTSLSIPFLKKSEPEHSASVTILTSNQGICPDPASPLMSVSASMVQMMIKTVALETATYGVRINGVATGVAKTAARVKKEGRVTRDDINRNREYLYQAA